jgi:hypothetical protein
MDAIPVALDSIPRMAPEDVAENALTRTAAVTSHNCHWGQQKTITADDSFSTSVTAIECRGILNGARSLC